MIATITLNEQQYTIDLMVPLDIALPIQAADSAASAWYCPPAIISPVMTEHFIGDVKLGGAVNFNNIFFNPHANGTHTECVGHISKEFVSINQVLKRFFFKAQLISIQPEQQNKDTVITTQQIISTFEANKDVEALIIRTLPNSALKKTKQYSNTNPAYVQADAMNWLYEQGIKHFMIDTPSVDKELDEGVLAAHHQFWNYPQEPRLDATITEMIYVPEAIEDGHYMLNLQIAAFENDASPSKPTLYRFIE